MNAPDRSAAVAGLVAANQQIFTVDRHDENRRAFLPTICSMLNAIERVTGIPEAWGVLVKGDRTPAFIPCDVIVWAPSGEHFDVLTGTGASWTNRGPIAVRSALWAWASAAVVAPDGSPTPIEPTSEPPAPPPDDPDDPAHIERFLEALDRLYDGLAGIGAGLAALERRMASIETEGLRMRFR